MPLTLADESPVKVTAAIVLLERPNEEPRDGLRN